MRNLIACVLGFVMLFCGCASKTATKDDIDDLDLIISRLEVTGECGIASALGKLDDELFIRLLGPSLIKEDPKAITPKQAEFYALVMQSKTVPRGKDKEALINMFTAPRSERCTSMIFLFKNPDLRRAMIASYRTDLENSAQLARDIRADKVTYEQIAQKASEATNGVSAQLIDGLMADILKQRPDMQARLQAGIMSAIQPMKELLGRYDLDFSALKQ